MQKKVSCMDEPCSKYNTKNKKAEQMFTNLNILEQTFPDYMTAISP